MSDFILYPDTASDKLGHAEVLRRLAGLCLSEAARERAQALPVLTEPEEIRRALRQAVEFKELLGKDEPLPLDYLPPVGKLLAHARIENSFLNEQEFHTLRRWLGTVRRVTQYFRKREEKYPELAELLRVSAFDTGFVQEIDRVVGPEGQIKNSASPELARLRRQQAEMSSGLRGLMQRLLKDARQNKWTDSPELTIRGDRLVIPVAANHKHKLPGFVHDVSNSGQTVFIEPLEALQQNNDIQEARLRERDEIRRILFELTEQLRPLVPEYKLFSEYITEIDLIRAKARLALDLNAGMPNIKAEGAALEIRDGRHPLLCLAKSWEKVVPMDARLDAGSRILLISGPNAGGKSVALQTTGLLQLMLQSGLLAPADEASSFPVFRKLFLDMGDDQSIQNDLSTYTSHLSHMQHFLGGLDEHSLFLIDEFGTGTDPEMGGAMAETLLEKFEMTRARGVITTHYGNLKEYAEGENGVVNGAMAFDLAEIAPLYRLEQGAPGSSYAFEIARRVGVPENVIRLAREKTGRDRANAERLLSSLKLREEEIAGLKKELEEKISRQESVNQQLAEAEKELRQQKRELTRQTKERAAEVLRKAQMKVEETVRKIRDAQAGKQETQQLRKELNQALAEAAENALPEELAKEAGEALLDPAFERVKDEQIRQGDWVQLPDSAAVGKVLEFQGKRALVAIDELRTSAKTADLIKVAPVEEKPEKKTSNRAQYTNPDKVAETPRELDLRGMYADEAIQALDRFMDAQIVAGREELRLLHGKGTYVLRDAVRRHLRASYPEVANMYDATRQSGGGGVTIVRLAYA